MMNIDDDTIGSMAFKHNQFEYHGIDDNYPLSFVMFDSKKFLEFMDLLNAHFSICFNNNKFLVNMTILSILLPLHSKHSKQSYSL